MCLDPIAMKTFVNVYTFCLFACLFRYHRLVYMGIWALHIFLQIVKALRVSKSAVLIPFIIIKCSVPKGHSSGFTSNSGIFNGICHVVKIITIAESTSDIKL